MWSSGRSEAALLAALPAPVDIRPVRSSRRFRLRFDEASGTFKLTCPWRSSRRSALAWAAEQREWMEAQLARAEPSIPLVAGASIPIEGRETRILWSASGQRTPMLTSDGTSLISKVRLNVLLAFDAPRADPAVGSIVAEPSA